MRLINEIDYSTNPAGKPGSEWGFTGSDTILNWDAAGYYVARNYGYSRVTPFSPNVVSLDSPSFEADLEMTANETTSTRMGVLLSASSLDTTGIHFYHENTRWVLAYTDESQFYGGTQLAAVVEGGLAFGEIVPSWTPRCQLKLSLSIARTEGASITIATGYLNGKKILEAPKTIPPKSDMLRWRPVLMPYYCRMLVRSTRFGDDPLVEATAPSIVTRGIVTGRTPVVAAQTPLYFATEGRPAPPDYIRIIPPTVEKVPVAFTLASELPRPEYGWIRGTVKIKNIPTNIPVSRHVFLVCELSMQVVSRAYSQPDGEFIFHRVPVGNSREYTILSYDTDTGFGAVIADHRRPALYREPY